MATGAFGVWVNGRPASFLDLGPKDSGGLGYWVDGRPAPFYQKTAGIFTESPSTSFYLDTSRTSDKTTLEDRQTFLIAITPALQIIEEPLTAIIFTSNTGGGQIYGESPASSFVFDISINDGRFFEVLTSSFQIITEPNEQAIYQGGTPLQIDDFERVAADALGSFWVEYERAINGSGVDNEDTQTFVLTGTGLMKVSGTKYGVAVWAHPLSEGDQFAELQYDHSNLGISFDSGPALRYQNQSPNPKRVSAYAAVYNGTNKLTLKRYTANDLGVWNSGTNLKQTTVTLVSTDVIRLQVVSGYIVAFRNNQALMSVAEDGLTGGVPAMVVNQVAAAPTSEVFWDNWKTAPMTTRTLAIGPVFSISVLDNFPVSIENPKADWTWSDAEEEMIPILPPEDIEAVWNELVILDLTYNQMSEALSDWRSSDSIQEDLESLGDAFYWSDILEDLQTFLGLPNPHTVGKTTQSNVPCEVVLVR